MNHRSRRGHEAEFDPRFTVQPRDLVYSLFSIIAILVAFGPCLQVSWSESAAWVVHHRHQDFAAGTLGNAGENIYVTADGSIEMIHRWDLNNDGYLDILAGQSHNTVENEEVLIYWGGPSGPRSLMPPLPDHQPLGRLLREIRSREAGITRLPSDGGGRSLSVDLNSDGWLDLVFCNYIHNFSVHMDAIIYWGTPQGFDPRRVTRLPTLMAKAVAAADFNADGFVDLAFANEGIEGGRRFGYHQHLESYIYWNGPTGFAVGNRTQLPSISATDCAAGDLNGDGYPELILVNNNEEHQSLYVYWNGSEGLREDRLEIRHGGDPVGAELLDINRDHHLDLVVLHQDHRAEIFLGDGQTVPEKAQHELPTIGAVEVRDADLNRDGFTDLIFPNAGEKGRQVSYIYWGDKKGFSTDHRQALPTQYAWDASVADFDGNGWLDVVFANERDDQTYDVDSYLYWNGPQGFDAADRALLKGFGPVSSTAGDFNRDGHPDLALISRTSGATAYGESPGSLIYWGNPHAHYSAAAVTHLPTTRDAMAVADLNRDGFVDIAFPNGDLYWGGPEGYAAARRTQLGLVGNGVTVADLNRDGYLDLVVPAGSAQSAGGSIGQIVWGRSDGYELSGITRLSLSTRYSQTATIADLNRDGFLDLIFPDVDSPQVDFFWGDASGEYGAARYTSNQLLSASTITRADFNSDGWLDLIFGGVYDASQFGRPMREARLLWGGPQGYSLSRSLKLEAFESEEQAVADLNRDGYLDIVMSNYHGYTTRSIPLFIYWGDSEATYSTDRRTELPAESSLGLTVADLNGDSWLDLVVFNHQDRGDHGAGAEIYWGGSEGFSIQRRHWIQTFGVHFTVRRDIGHLFHRGLEEEYVSAPLSCPAGKRPSRLNWKADTPHGTKVKFQIRTANSEAKLSDAEWMGIKGPATYYEQPGTIVLDSPPQKRQWFQYRALLITPDGGSTPVLHEVGIDVTFE